MNALEDLVPQAEPLRAHLRCPRCAKAVTINKGGTLRAHKTDTMPPPGRCPGSGMKVADARAENAAQLTRGR